MNITQKLMDEHQLILKYTRLLEAYIMALKENPERIELSQRLGDFISFVREYADRYHHAKEEDLLFKFMEEPGVLTHCNPLPQMTMEHDEGRKYIKGMEENLLNHNVNAALRFAWGWLQLLRDHISKEDNVLYPMAEEGISDNRKTQLADLYLEAEKKQQGAELENKYLKLFDELLFILEKITSKKVQLGE